jgi:hypothetical protein
MAKITYTDKVTMNENADVPAINKVQASDMNEIKNVVNQNYDEFLTKNAATFGITSNQSFTGTSEHQIVLNKTITQAGTELSLSNGSVVIGNGINYIKISGQGICNTYTTNGLRRIIVRDKNSNIIARSMAYYDQDFNTNITISPVIYPVSSGDTITFSMTNAGATTLYNSGAMDTYFTIEAL